MRLLDNIIAAVRRGDKPPPTGTILDPRRDALPRSYPADGITPQRLRRILRDADDGDLVEQLELFDQMEEKDAHLYSVAQTRRLGVTGLPWRIVAPSAPVDDAAARHLAQQVTDYCRETLHALSDLDTALAHLARGIGRNIAVAELIWAAGSSGPELVDVVPVAFDRLRSDEHQTLRIATRDEPQTGIEPTPLKFIIHRPHGPGPVARGALLRVSAAAFLAKHYAMKDWLIYMEVFGMPVRIARYQPGATPQEKRELLDMLQRLGTDAAGIFSKSVELEIKNARMPGETAPYESICTFFNRELTKAWLGQTLTADTARVSTSVGAAQVHQQVREDIRDADLRSEAATLRRDLLTPLVQLRFGPTAPVPHFQRVVERRHEPESLARTLAAAVNELGLDVPADWAHEHLGVPRPGPRDTLLPGKPMATASVAEFSEQ